MGIAEFAFSAIASLLSSVIYEGVKLSSLGFLQKKKIKNRIENAIVNVIAPLMPFLQNEGVPEDKQRRLIETCVEELRTLAEKPARFFEGSLDGQRIFEDLYEVKGLPQVITEDRTEDVYALLFPRIASFLCKFPPAVKDWEHEAWRENFSRFDDIADELQRVYDKVDALTSGPITAAETLLIRVRRIMAQKLAFKLDMTGLRAGRPDAGALSDLFVHPAIREIVEQAEDSQQTVAEGAADSLRVFTRRGHLSVVRGAPGAGKSTWSKWLHQAALGTEWAGVAVRLELRSLASNRLPSLQALLRSEVSLHLAEELTQDVITRWLKENQVMFIIDGFDEVPPSERNQVQGWLTELALVASECPIVVTSRPLTTDHLKGLGKTWTNWEMLPFNEERIVDYIKRWHTHSTLLADADRSVDAPTLANEWRTDPTIVELTGNPLLLSTLLMVHHLDGSLPNGRSALYKRYVEGMLGIWDDRRKVKASAIALPLLKKHELLRRLACNLFLRNIEEAGDDVIKTIVSEVLQEMKLTISVADVLAWLCERTGLMIGPGTYSFIHKSVMEYLVAEAVFQGDLTDASKAKLDRFYLFNERESDRWNTVTFLWAGLAPIADLELFIKSCLESESWSLAYGLLADQYERLPIDIRRKFLLILGEDEGEGIPFEMYSAFWLFGRPSSIPISLGIPKISIRAISGGEFLRLVRRAFLDGTLSWTDCTATAGPGRDLFWMYSIISVGDNLDQWELLIQSHLPADGMTDGWMFWILRGPFYKIHQEHIVPDNLEVWIKVLKKKNPRYIEFIPFAFMNSFIETEKFNRPVLLKKPEYSRFLGLLPDLAEGKVEENWLVGTSSWRFREHVLEKHSVDLLDSFDRQLQDWAEAGKVARDESFDNALRYVDTLRTRRNALLASSDRKASDS